MKINLVRLYSTNDDKINHLKTEDDFIINQINDELYKDDLFIEENASNSVLDLYFIETGGTENLFKSLINEDKNKVYFLLSTGRNNSLAATLEIKTYCDLHDLRCVLFLTSDESSIALLKSYALAMSIKKEMSNERLGVIGEPSDWLIANETSFEDLESLFDFKIISIPMEELYDEIDKNILVEAPHQNTLINKYKGNISILKQAFNIYGAIKRIVDKYHLTGLTIRCFDLLKRYENTSCLAFSLLNEEGVSAACEGDINALISMRILHYASFTSSFQVNPSDISLKDHKIILAHCTAPYNMGTNHELLTHFESDKGIGVKMDLPLSEVTIFKFFYSKKRSVKESLVVGGRIVSNPNLPGFCRTQVEVDLSNEDLYHYLNKNCGNHLLLSFSDCSYILICLLTLMDLENNGE